MKLEQSLYEARPVESERLKYTIGDLESLSASVLYTGNLPPMGPGGFGGGDFGNGGGPKFKDYPLFGALKIPNVGTSNFKVYLPKSNVVDRSLKIFTPETKLIINQYQRIKGKSGIDYFNLDGSSAGIIFGLNKSELDYLKK